MTYGSPAQGYQQAQGKLYKLIQQKRLQDGSNGRVNMYSRSGTTPYSS